MNADSRKPLGSYSHEPESKDHNKSTYIFSGLLSNFFLMHYSSLRLRLSIIRRASSSYGPANIFTNIFGVAKVGSFKEIPDRIENLVSQFGLSGFDAVISLKRALKVWMVWRFYC